MIRICGEIREEIRREAARAYPRECVGALLGRADEEGKTVTEIVPLANEHESPRRTYRVSAEAYREVEREADRRELTLLGFYHSHPDVIDTPSRDDLEQGAPFFSYLIVSVLGGRPARESSWVLREDRRRFEREPIVTPDGTGTSA